MASSLPFAPLRTFEAVARLGSFSAAAAELNVSQSAVSQQVKTLEDWLGQNLLVRGQRRSEPTLDGARLARAISDGFGQVAEVCEGIRETRRNQRTITISCLPGFAWLWLFPRLIHFDMAHPDLPISVTTEVSSGFSSARADVGIRYGDGDNPGFVAEALMDEMIFPVCAPALRAGPLPLQTIADLSQHTLIRDEFSARTRSPPTWGYWARSNDLSLPKPARSRTFGQSNMVLQAAISGLGVAMGRTPLVNAALMEGRLLRPFAQTAVSAPKYWLVYEERALGIERIAVFLDWLRSEAASMPVLPASDCMTD